MQDQYVILRLQVNTQSYQRSKRKETILLNLQYIQLSLTNGDKLSDIGILTKSLFFARYPCELYTNLCRWITKISGGFNGEIDFDIFVFLLGIYIR